MHSRCFGFRANKSEENVVGLLYCIKSTQWCYTPCVYDHACSLKANRRFDIENFFRIDQNDFDRNPRTLFVRRSYAAQSLNHYAFHIVLRDC
jgi:hypothetical protein